MFLGVPQSIYAIEAVKLDEPVVFPLPEEAGRLAPEAVPEIVSRLPDCDACLAGPGLGRSPGVRAVVEAVPGGGPVSAGSGRRRAECFAGAHRASASAEGAYRPDAS
ncbi:MAG: hypothetical protein ACLVHV_11110 [Oscillospiraceae bacterium]